jgi:hypothetical protein
VLLGRGPAGPRPVLSSVHRTLRLGAVDVSGHLLFVLVKDADPDRQNSSNEAVLYGHALERTTAPRRVSSCTAADLVGVRRSEQVLAGSQLDVIGRLAAAAAHYHWIAVRPVTVDVVGPVEDPRHDSDQTPFVMV